MVSEVSKRPRIERLAVEFPANVKGVVVAKYGVQSMSTRNNKIIINEIKHFFTGEFAPVFLERMNSVDRYGYVNEFLMGYWLNISEYENWKSREDVQGWWSNISTDLEYGMWKEVSYTKKEYFQHSTKPSVTKNGIGNVLPLVNSKNYVKSTLYRSRFPAAVYDDFESALKHVPKAEKKETKGKRISVRSVNNLCYLREGEDRSACSVEENKVIDTYIKPLVDGWINSLESFSDKNGCLVMRNCNEVDLEADQSLNKKTFDVFMLSLDHIEKAARTYLVHQNLIKSFVEFKQKGKTPNYLVWVEAHIIKEGDLKAEYINCHPDTGLLPYFEEER